jgi:hypothetical protein
MEGHPIKRAVAKLVARGTLLGGGLIARRIGMGKLRKARLPILVERGENPSVLIIAFTGGQQKLNFPVYEFFETTQTLGCSRILLWDRYYMYYHHGVDRKRRDWPSLLDYLKREIARLRPQTIFCIGVSSGGYAAMIAGHYLGADYVHAFGPQTKIAVDKEGIRNARFRFNRWRLSISRRVFMEVLDLVPMLQKPNGKTKFFVHYGARHKIDREFAERVVGLPSVVTLGYPINSHGVAVFLGKKRFLEYLLEVANQDKLTELARSCFGDQVVITLPGSGNGDERELRDLRSRAGILRSNPQTT